MHLFDQTNIIYDTFICSVRNECLNGTFSWVRNDSIDRFAIIFSQPSAILLFMLLNADRLILSSNQKAVEDLELEKS